MRTQDFLTMVGQPGGLNYLVLCPDELGLPMLLQRTLLKTTAAEDLLIHDAEGLSKDRARELENETRKAPRGGSALQIVIIHGLQKLPTESTGPLLKTVEEARYTRFVFQAQALPKKILTLASRAAVIRLPFLSRNTVLASMKALSYDAKTADELGLYDGTLAGTIRNLRTKDELTAIKREMGKGLKGIPALFYQGETGSATLLNSLALRPVLKDLTTKAEEAFLDRNADANRRKLVLYLVLGRQE